MSDDRKNRLSGRFNGSSDAGDKETPTDDVDETTTETEDTTDTGGDEPKWVNMRLPKALADELDLRYRRLDLEARESGGEGIEKNTDFYPAVVRAGLEHVDLDAVRDE